MKIKRNPLIALLLCLIFGFSVCAVAQAHEVPDLTRPCSVTLTMRDGGTIVPGGSLTIYRVGEVTEDDGNYFFQPTGDFSAWGASFDDLDPSSGLALQLQAYAAQHSIAGTATEDVDDQGEAAFDGLQAGLYLITQHHGAPGYEKISPFLISLPNLENGTYRYDLTAEPKTELKKEPVPPPDDPPDDPSDLPQTGQLWWPVPILACAGVLFFAVGIRLNRRRSSDAD